MKLYAWRVTTAPSSGAFSGMQEFVTASRMEIRPDGVLAFEDEVPGAEPNAYPYRLQRAYGAGQWQSVAFSYEVAPSPPAPDTEVAK